MNSRSRFNVTEKAPLLLFVIIALAAFLRAFTIGSESLWLDEAVSVKISSHSLTSIISLATQGCETNPPLYYMLLHLWTRLFGQSEVAIRSLSACLGTISVLLIYKVGKSLFDRRAGILAAFLLATSAYAIEYSQEARQYSLLLLLTLLSFLLFAMLLKANQRKTITFIAYALINIMLCYTHMFGLLMIGAQVLYFILFQKKYPGARLLFWAAQAVTVVAFLPWAFFIATKIFPEASHALTWIPEPSLTVVANVIGALSGAGYLSRPLGIILVFILLLLCLAGIFGSYKQLQSNRLRSLLNSLQEPRTALLLIWFLFPLIMTIILSITVMPLLVSRYLIGTTAAIYLLTALGISNISPLLSKYRLRSNLTAIMLTGLIIIISIPGLHTYYAQPQKDPWRDVAVFIRQEAKPGDVMIFAPDYNETPFEYYYRGDPEISIAPEEAIVDEAFAATWKRVWLVSTDNAAEEDHTIKQQLLLYYGNDSLILRKEFGDIQVSLSSGMAN